MSSTEASKRASAACFSAGHIETIGLIAAAKEAGLCASARERYVALFANRFRVDLAVVNDVLRDLGEAELPL